MPEWTDSQLTAIEARGQATVVSAAAGSGKTTVLIERIIRMITSGECSVDELLIVTFTRAATAEIRSRLATGITEALKKEPENRTLIRQQMLVPSADIFTIDAFCAGLVRENYEALGISPDFKTLDDAGSSLLMTEALTETLDRYYNEETPEFDILNTIFKEKGRSSVTLESVVRTLADKCRSRIDPEKALEESLSYYNYEVPAEKSPAAKEAVRSFLAYLDYATEGLKAGIGFCTENGDTLAKLHGILCSDYDFFCSCRPLIEALDFEELKKKAAAHTFVPWASPRGENPLKNRMEYLTARYCRDAASKYFKKNCELLIKYFVTDGKGIEKDRDIQLPALKTLLAIVRDYTAAYTTLKHEKNAFDFSDIGHMAYRLLTEETGEKTALARDLSRKYKQILIDEYQDTDELQDAIFRMISDDEKNLFMVGDIKQSIYAFRNAMPELFLKKKETYSGSLTLGDNFRSSYGIVNFVNFVFSQLMTKGCGDIDYRKPEEQLRYGKNEPKDNHRIDVELHLLPGAKTEEEGRFIAETIEKAMKDDPSLSYADFVILLRTGKGKSSKMADALTAKNIPVIFDSDASFFETSDTGTVLSLLHVIDNPLQDIHLLTVLLSPVFGLSADKIAQLRTGSENRKKHLYANLLAHEEEDEAIRKVCDRIRLYRQLSISMPAGELIRKLYADTLLPDIVAAMPNGISRRANLLLLQDYADSYEQNNEPGISNFVAFLDAIVENRLNLKTASLNAGTADAVRIMTIHKSKGLQFHTCFVPDLGAAFYEHSGPIEYGTNVKIGIKTCNPANGDVYPSFINKQIHRQNRFSGLSEELRVFYVAMTRAKNRLILTGAPTKAGLERAAFSSSLDENGCINPQSYVDAGSMLELILQAVIHHRDAFRLREMLGIDEGSMEIIHSETPLLFAWHESPETAGEETEETVPLTGHIDPVLLAALKERMAYEYPYLALSAVPTKKSASATEAAGFDGKFFASAVPEFLRREKLTAAQKGTCLHRFMQFADFHRAKQDAEAEVRRLKERGYFTAREAASIDTAKIDAFFRSDIAHRMEQSPNIMREKKFAVLVPAGRFNPALPAELGNEKVLIQGIADCVFEEDGELMIVDYKTDRTKVEQELIKRHRDQLLTYKEALSEILGLPVRACFIYAFSLDRELQVI